MQAGIFKRLFAYITDILIINAVIFLITSSVNMNNGYQETLTELTEKYTLGEVTYEEFSKEYNKISYNNQKDNYIYYTVEFIITVGYFIVFQTLNKGQTLGKKLLKLRVVNNTDNSNVNFKNIILRSIFLYSTLSLLLTVCAIKFLSMKTYSNIYGIISTVETMFLLITFAFMLYRKDKRGLHDVIANTKVISE